MTAGRGPSGAAPPAAPPPEPRPLHRGMVFFTAAVAMFMTSVNVSIVATALGTLQRDLDTTANWAGWTITAYGLGMLVMLPVSGKLADRYGRRRVFLASTVVFTLASLACGLSNDIVTLILFRVLQAAGGAGFTPAATGLFAEHFGSIRDRAISLYGSIFSVGAMAGPIFGGLFVTHLTWHAIFLMNVPIGAVVIPLALYYIPRDRRRTPDRAVRTDVAGAVLLGLGLLGGMLAAALVGEADRPLPESMALAAPLAVLCAVCLVAFFRHIRRTAHPFIAPRLIGGAGFRAVNIVTAVFGGTAIGAVALVPLYASGRYGIDALTAGTLLIAQGAADGVFTLGSALMLRRTGYRLPMYVGSVAVVAGLVALAAGAPAGIPPVVWLGAGAFFIGIGTGALGPASRNAGLQLAPEHAGMVAALRSMEWQMGSIVVVSVSTAVMTAAADPVAAQAWTYLVFAAVLVCALPLIHGIQDHRGAW